jgi:uncharacterized OB-fold protein
MTPTAQITEGIPPEVTEETRPFWEGTAGQQLLVEQCQRCAAFIFPPRGVCRFCWSRELRFVDIPGPGGIYSFTVNHQRWWPQLEVPYAIALVEFPGAPGVRIIGRVQGCRVEDIAVGMIVDIGFEAGPAGFSIPSFVARTVER